MTKQKNKTTGREKYLTAQEQDQLVKLGKDIQADLSCDINGTELPCRTDRLEAVANMQRYLQIHDFKVVQKSLNTVFKEALDMEQK